MKMREEVRRREETGKKEKKRGQGLRVHTGKRTGM
jgi:hypothetical protein